MKKIQKAINQDYLNYMKEGWVGEHAYQVYETGSKEEPGIGNARIKAKKKAEATILNKTLEAVPEAVKNKDYIKKTCERGVIIWDKRDYNNDTCDILYRVYSENLKSKISKYYTRLWKRSLGGSRDDQAYSILPTVHGGCIVAGYTRSYDGDVTRLRGGLDGWVVKLNEFGNIDWKHIFGGTNDEFIRSLEKTFDGGYIMAVSSASTNYGMLNHGGDDFWIVKIDSIGELEWQRTPGGSKNDLAYSFQQTDDGGYIVTGFTESDNSDVSHNHGGKDIWVVKLSEVGNLEWQEVFGGSGDEAAETIKQTQDKGFILAGFTESDDGDVNENHGHSDFCVLKLGRTGNIQWQKTFGGSHDDKAAGVLAIADNGYLVAGSSKAIIEGRLDYNAWLIKLDTGGEIQWERRLGGNDFDEICSIHATSDGKYILAGSTYSSKGDFTGNHGGCDYWILKLDSEGTLQWQRVLGGSDNDFAQSIRQTVDEGYVVAGYSDSKDGEVSGGRGGFDFWIVMIDNDGRIKPVYSDK